MGVVLITDDYYPKLGGIANVLFNLFKSLRNKDQEIYVFNPFSDGLYEFKISTLKRKPLINIYSFIRKKKFYYLLMRSFIKIIFDKKVAFSIRLKLLLYYLSNPAVC